MPTVGGAARLNSLVQTATGFNHAEGVAADRASMGPKELPAQMLDHATGYFMAFGAMMAKARQAREGGSWHVRGFAGADRTVAVGSRPDRRWLADPGLFPGLRCEPFMDELSVRLRCTARGQTVGDPVEDTAFWARPSMPLGSHLTRWRGGLAGQNGP